MATQKDTKMSQRMKGAFGKMKSGKMKFNMTKPKSGQSTNQLKSMFNRFNKKPEDDRKWSTILPGSWEIELPVGEFLNASSHALSDTNDNNRTTVNDPNSVSNQQCPMVQIYENLKVISIPLSTDIANPHIHEKYLASKCISTNSTRLTISKDKDKRLFLINYKKEDDIDNAILEGTINTDTFTIRWSDGSSWSKQGIMMKTEDDDISADTPSKSMDTEINTQEMKELRSQLEILKEKEQMAKSQTQATMGQFADLSQQYAKITTEHENVQKEYQELQEKYDVMSKEFEEMKSTLAINKEELNRVRGDMIFEKQQQIQTKLTQFKVENEEYAKSIKLQQDRILSLQDQLQSGHIATRQYTKTIEDLEAKIRVIDKDKIEAKAVLNELNNKFVTSQTNLDDAKHQEMLMNDRHEKDIQVLNVKHRQEIDKLERGFQETLRQNERKMLELRTLRNNYEKKNASLTKDVKKLIIQLEKQTKSFKSNSVTKSIKFNDIDDNGPLKKLRDENAQLSEELIRKSQSLMNALRALAEFHQNPQNITKAITSDLSHVEQYMHHDDNNGVLHHKTEQHPSSYADVSNQLKVSMEQNLENTEPLDVSPASIGSVHASNGGVVIGAKYGPNDAPPNTTSTQYKFNLLKNKLGNKMKEKITKLQQNMVNNQVQRMKSSQDDTLNELNARSAIKESEKILIITKSKQQLNSQCTELQGLANELSSTIEQKEVILESLRFANTYLGKRVIALEKLMHMQPGKEIKNQDELIREALNFSSDAEQKEDQNTKKISIVNDELDTKTDDTQENVQIETNVDDTQRSRVETEENKDEIETHLENTQQKQEENEEDEIETNVDNTQQNEAENVKEDDVVDRVATEEDEEKDEIESNVDDTQMGVQQKQEENHDEEEINLDNTQQNEEENVATEENEEDEDKDEIESNLDDIQMGTQQKQEENHEEEINLDNTQQNEEENEEDEEKDEIETNVDDTQQKQEENVKQEDVVDENQDEIESNLDKQEENVNENDNENEMVLDNSNELNTEND